MITIFNKDAKESVIEIKRKGFLGDFILAARSGKDWDRILLRKSTRVNQMIWHLPAWSQTPQGCVFWIKMFNRYNIEGVKINDTYYQTVVNATVFH